LVVAGDIVLIEKLGENLVLSHPYVCAIGANFEQLVKTKSLPIVAGFVKRIRLRAKWRSNLQFRKASNVGLPLQPGDGIGPRKN
jgi:hypothetical protein